MSFLDIFRPHRAYALAAEAPLEDTAPSFAVDPATVNYIDPAVFGLTAYADTTSPAPRIDRRSAMQVPAVKRARDLVAGVLGGLPLDLFAPDNTVQPWALFDQPEPDVPRSVTLARTFEDMLFEGVAWWQVLEYGWHNYPTKVRRLDPRSVSVQATGRVYVTRDGHTATATDWVPDRDLIRFDAPTDGLLIAGARAIRACLALEVAAARYADEPMPLGFFTPADPADPFAQDDADETANVKEFLDMWRTARKERSTGYVPASMKYNAVQFNPEQLQLAQARQHAVLEIARAAGLDPEYLAVPVTSRTYFNAFDRTKNFLDFTLGGYRQAFEDRLGMGDVTARGYTGRLNLDAFNRTDALTRYQAYEVGARVGALTTPEIREAEGKPAIASSDGIPNRTTAAGDVPTPAPAAANPQETSA